MYESAASLFTESVTSAFNEVLHEAFPPSLTRAQSNLFVMSQKLQSQFPAGVDYVLVGASASPGLNVIRAHGIIAVLIGLQLPAVQKVVGDPHCPEALQLLRMINTSGKVGIAPEYLNAASWSWSKVKGLTSKGLERSGGTPLEVGF